MAEDAFPFLDDRVYEDERPIDTFVLHKIDDQLAYLEKHGNKTTLNVFGHNHALDEDSPEGTTSKKLREDLCPRYFSSYRKTCIMTAPFLAWPGLRKLHVRFYAHVNLPYYTSVLYPSPQCKVEVELEGIGSKETTLSWQPKAAYNKFEMIPVHLTLELDQRIYQPLRTSLRIWVQSKLCFALNVASRSLDTIKLDDVDANMSDDAPYLPASKSGLQGLIVGVGTEAIRVRDPYNISGDRYNATRGLNETTRSAHGFGADIKAVGRRTPWSFVSGQIVSDHNGSDAEDSIFNTLGSFANLGGDGAENQNVHLEYVGEDHTVYNNIFTGGHYEPISLDLYDDPDLDNLLLSQVTTFPPMPLEEDPQVRRVRWGGLKNGALNRYILSAIGITGVEVEEEYFENRTPPELMQMGRGLESATLLSFHARQQALSQRPVILAYPVIGTEHPDEDDYLATTWYDSANTHRRKATNFSSFVDGQSATRFVDGVNFTKQCKTIFSSPILVKDNRFELEVEIEVIPWILLAKERLISWKQSNYDGQGRERTDTRIVPYAKGKASDLKKDGSYSDFNFELSLFEMDTGSSVDGVRFISQEAIYHYPLDGSGVFPFLASTFWAYMRKLYITSNPKNRYTINADGHMQLASEPYPPGYSPKEGQLFDADIPLIQRISIREAFSLSGRRNTSNPIGIKLDFDSLSEKRRAEEAEDNEYEYNLDRTYGFTVVGSPAVRIYSRENL